MKDFPNSFILFLLSISSIAVLLRLLSSHSLLQLYDIKEEKNMRLKKVMATGLVAALALSTMVGCSSKKDSSDQKKIGVVQLVEHDALDASYKGFKDGLEKAGYKDGDKIKIEYKNAQNEQSNCQTIAKQFVTDKCDLVLAIATPAAQAMANESKDIPILVTAVTDPADAKLVKSNKKPGTNVSGTSDLTPVAKQMNLLKE